MKSRPPVFQRFFLVLACAIVTIASAPAQFEQAEPEAAFLADLRSQIQGASQERGASVLAEPLYEFAELMLDSEGEKFFPENMAGIADLAEEFRLIATIQKMLRPSPKTKGKPLARYGAICELLRDREGAIDHYRRALESDPADHAVRLRLFGVMLDKKPRTAISHLEGLGADHIAYAGDRLRQHLDGERSFEETTNLVGKMADFLEEQDGKYGPSPSWIPDMLDHLADGYFTDYFIDPFYRVELFGKEHVGWRGRSAKPASADKLHEQFCRLMMANPELAQEGFRRFVARADEKQQKELPALAKATLEIAAAASDFDDVDLRWNDVTLFALAKPSAAEFLARHARRSGEQIDFPEVKVAEVRNEIRQWRDLYLGDDSAFENAARQRIALGDGLAVVRCWVERDSQVDLTPMFLEQIENENAIDDYLEAVLVRDGREALGSRLSQVTEAFMGKGAAGLPDRLHGIGRPGAKVAPEAREYIAVLAQFAANPSLTFPVLDFLEKQAPGITGRIGLPEKFTRRSYPALEPEFYRTDIERVKRFFESSPFLTDFKNFPLYLSDDLNDGDSFTIDLLDTIADLPLDALNRLRGALKTLPDCFGRQVLLAACGPNTGLGMNQVMRKFGAHRKQLEALTEDEQQRYATFIYSVKVADGAAPKFEKDRLDTIHWLLDLRRQRLERESEARLAEAAGGEGARERRDTIIREAGVLLQRLAATDLDKSKALFKRVTESVGDTPGRGFKFRGDHDGELSAANELLGDYLRTSDRRMVRLEGTWRERMPDIFQRLKFATQMMAKPDPGDVQIEWNGNYRWAVDLIGRKFASPTRRESHVVTLGYLDTISEDVKPEHFPVIIDMTFGIMGWWRKEVSEEKFQLVVQRIMAELQKRADGGKNAAMAEEMLNAVRVYMKRYNKSNAQGITDREKLPPEQLHYLKVLESDALSPLSRLGVAEAVVGRLGWATEPPLAHAYCDLLIENLKAGHRISTPQIYSALARLRNRPFEGEVARQSHELAPLLKPLLIPDGWRLRPDEIRFRMKASFRYAELCLRVGDIESARETFFAYPDYVKDAPMAWLHTMTRYGQHDIAVTIVRSEFEQLALDLPHSEWTFEPALAAQIPGLRSAAKREDVAFLTELMISSFPDVFGGGEMHIPDAVSARLVELAGRFPRELEDRAARESAALLLGATVPSARAAKPLLEELSAARPLSQLVGIEGNEAERLRRIHLAHIYADVADGEADAFNAAIADLSPGAVEHRNEFATMVHKVCHYSEYTTLKHWSHWTTDQAEEMCAAWRDLLSSPHFMRKTYSGIRHSTFAMILHAMFDKMDAFEEAVEALPERERNVIKKFSEEYDLSFTLREIKGADFSGVPEAIRPQVKLDIVKRLLNNPLGFWAHRDFAGIVNEGWLTREEFMASAAELIEAAPGDGLTALRVARFAFEDGDIERAKQLLASTDNVPDTPLTLYVEARRGRLFFDIGEYYESYFAFTRAMRIVASDTPIGGTTATRPEFRNYVIKELVEKTAAQQEKDGDILPTLRILALGKGGIPEAETFWRLARDTYTRASLKAEKDGDAKKALGFIEAATVADDAMLTAAPKRPQPPLGDPRTRFKKLLEQRWGKPQLLIMKGAKGWQYSAAGTEPDAAWRGREFDASAWKTGKAPLGYGEKESLATEIPSKVPGSGKKMMAAYFRRPFKIEDLDAVRAVAIDLRRDDGAVVYVNGHEVARQNLPEKAQLKYGTRAKAAVSGDNETRFFPIQVPRKYLVEGENIVAVEVHQVNETSSDISFDLRLRSNAYHTKEMIKVAESETLPEKIGEAWTILSKAIGKREK